MKWMKGMGMTHNHYIEKCNICGTVISQCRCAMKEKRIIYSICDKCKDKKDEFNFGDHVLNLAASEKNPIRKGIFVRENQQTYTLTDGHGKFWDVSKEVIVRDNKVF